MRYDLSVLWIEDTQSFYEESSEILNMYASDLGLSIRFKYVQNATTFLAELSRDRDHFKLYDLIFVDYSLSNDILGSQVINVIREDKIDTDILFYSSNKESDIRDTIKNDLARFEGVYVSNKNNFEDKSCFLINKNARRLTSIMSIRGFLMDQTSENDFTVNSFIFEKYNDLSQEQQKAVTKIILDYLSIRLGNFVEVKKKVDELITNKESLSIKQIQKFSNDVFTLELRYTIFSKIMELLELDGIAEISVSDYMENIVKMRNNLAHKKLVLCKTGRNICYFDTIAQQTNRTCELECEKCECINEKGFIISHLKWLELRKSVLNFAVNIDKLQNEILTKKA